MVENSRSKDLRLALRISFIIFVVIFPITFIILYSIIPADTSLIAQMGYFIIISIPVSIGVNYILKCEPCDVLPYPYNN